MTLARSRRRQVDVEDGDVRLVDLDFDVSVVSVVSDVSVDIEGDVNGGEGDSGERSTPPRTHRGVKQRSMKVSLHRFVRDSKSE